MKNMLNINEIRDTFQDCNINFLVGAGMSSPYLELLGSIEMLIEDLVKQKLSDKEKKIIEASLYKKYFDGVIVKNIGILESDKSADEVLDNYKKFLQSLNSILLSRKSTILSKQVNIFTTNIDVFLEKALEDVGLEYNDGFSGRFLPTFGLGNFKKSFFRKSLHYDNTSEIPVFNLLKLHGSLTWESYNEDNEDEELHFSSNLNIVRNIKDKIIPDGSLLEIHNGDKIENLITEAKRITTYKRSAIKVFLQAYEKLVIVNPTKEKFKDTLFSQAYYDLLRIYSNELEKENTVLVVMGFSFTDEHIRELTLRAAHSNPTLTIYIIAHTSKEKAQYEKKLNLRNVKNNNIKVIAPPQTKPSETDAEKDEFEFNIQNINEKIFDELLKKIEEQNSQAKLRKTF